MNCGCVVENTLLSINLNFLISAILVDGQVVSLSDNNQITISRLHVPAAEQDTTIGDPEIMIAMTLCNNAEAVSCVDSLKSLDTDSVVFSNRELMGSVCVDVRYQYRPPP